MTKDEIKICAFTVKANPPHMGVILALFKLLDYYNQVIIAYYASDGLLQVDQCTSMINIITSRVNKLAGKEVFKIIELDIDFSTISHFPKELKDAGVSMLVTTSNRVYANCTTKGIPVQRLTRARGFRDFYEQIAFTRGFLEDNVRDIFRGN